MAQVDLKRLLQKLNRHCTRALEAAAGQAVSAGHYEVTIDHVLMQLVDQPNVGVTAVLPLDIFTTGR